MGGVCGSPKDSSAEEAAYVPKITVTVVKVQGLPANQVPLEDRSLSFQCQSGSSDVGKWFEQRMTNVVDPLFNYEFELPAGILDFKVMEELSGQEAVCVGQANLDATTLEAYEGDLQLEGGSNTGAIITVKMKSEGYEYLANTAMADYTVTVDNPKKTKSLGLELDSTDQVSCFVSNVKANSFIDKHNQSAEASNKMPKGSYIVAYNGVDKSPPAIESQMKKAATTCEFTLRPMEVFRIALDRAEGQNLGVDVPKKPLGNSVLVQSVKSEGFVAKWNADHPEQEVKAKDRIVEVNGKTGKATQLIDMIKKAPNTSKVVLTISRMAPPPSQ